MDLLPYSRQQIDECDIEAVVSAMRSAWLTTGPAVERFEQAICEYTGASHAAAVSSGTAALHAACHAAGVGPGDEVIVPAITFVATANAAVYCGATPVFADVDPQTLLVDVSSVEACLSEKTAAIIGVDFAGQPCDYQSLRLIADRANATLIADAAHSIGASRDGIRSGQLADLSCFSFHPVKPMTSAEGGMVVSENRGMIEAVRRFRNHGIDTDFRQRASAGTFSYDMQAEGFNYRLSDLHAALGVSQLGRLDQWTARRNEIAEHYERSLADIDGVTPLQSVRRTVHARHLFVVRIDSARTGCNRDRMHAGLRSRGISANVHYRPVYHHSWYADLKSVAQQRCRNAENVMGEILSLPIFPAMSYQDVECVVDAIREIIHQSSTRRREINPALRSA